MNEILIRDIETGIVYSSDQSKDNVIFEMQFWYNCVLIIVISISRKEYKKLIIVQGENVDLRGRGIAEFLIGISYNGRASNEAGRNWFAR
jgi:hypothetical protein